VAQRLNTSGKDVCVSLTMCLGLARNLAGNLPVSCFFYPIMKWREMKVN